MNPAVLDPNREPSPEEVQRAVLDRIAVAISNELDELEHAVKERAVNAVAWISRNLMELAVWAEFCMESPTNARRFHDDAGRDSVELLKVPDGLFNEDPAFSFQKERERILEEARSKGVDDLDEPYVRVTNAAKQISTSAEFIWTNKMLSKFAHPTALYVITAYEDLEVWRERFYNAGRSNGEGALRRIEDFTALRSSVK
jgi:hypothetical protein